MPEVSWLLVRVLTWGRQRSPDCDDLLLPGDQELLLLDGVRLAGEAEVKQAGEHGHRLGVGGGGQQQA